MHQEEAQTKRMKMVPGGRVRLHVLCHHLAIVLECLPNDGAPDCLLLRKQECNSNTSTAETHPSTSKTNRARDCVFSDRASEPQLLGGG